MRLRVNDRERRVPDAWREETLLATLREHLGLVGAKYSCGIGVCGACVVHVGGEAVPSCTLRTGDVDGRSVLTIEGLGGRGGLAGEEGGLHPLQRAWIDERVAQCGYCQAGQIMQALALLSRNPRPSEAEIASSMEGNLCRCGTYDRIKKAIRRAADAMAGPGAGAEAGG